MHRQVPLCHKGTAKGTVNTSNGGLAHLTFLLEVTVEPGTSITVAADIEPSFLALGPFHLALGMNNRAWFYLLGETNVDLVADMQLNADYCAVRYEGSSTSWRARGSSRRRGRERLARLT